MFDVISVGSATIDVYANTHSELIKIKTEHSSESLICYPSGSKILMHNLNFITGGGGTNTAVSFARLGLKAAYLGNIGDDENGDLVMHQLIKDNVKFIGTIGKRDQTNFSMILDSIEGDRTILVCKSASQKLDWNKINKSKINSKWIYFSSLTGNAFKAAEKIAAYAYKKNIKIAFNPSNYQAKQGQKELEGLLKYTDLLVMNREEAALLTGLSKTTELKKLLKALLDFGPELVIITEGKKGANCCDGKHIYHIDGSKKKPVETTGAGDAFTSTFLGAIIKKKDISTCLKLAAANSASVINYSGAKEGLLEWDRLLDKAKVSPKVKVTKF